MSGYDLYWDAWDVDDWLLQWLPKRSNRACYHRIVATTLTVRNRACSPLPRTSFRATA